MTIILIPNRELTSQDKNNYYFLHNIKRVSPSTIKRNEWKPDRVAGKVLQVQPQYDSVSVWVRGTVNVRTVQYSQSQCGSEVANSMIVG